MLFIIFDHDYQRSESTNNANFLYLSRELLKFADKLENCEWKKQSWLDE